MDDQVRLLAVRSSVLSVDEVYAAVAHPGAGGVTLFVGTVRDEDDGRPVAGLGYEAHPSVQRELERVATAVAAEFPDARLAAVHRVGRLAVGDLAVVVAAACPHRAEAFGAARRLIDDLKASVPIWKHQTFTDGAEEWVGSP